MGRASAEVHRRTVAGAAVIAALATPGEIAAQPDRFDGVEASLGLAGWTGAQAARFEPGLRGLVALAAEVAPGRSVGAEVVYGRFSPDGEGSAVAEAALSLTGRMRFDEVGRTSPFLQLRLGLHRLMGTGPRSGVRQSGLLLGPEAGLLHRVGGEGLGLLAALSATWVWYGDVAEEGVALERTGGWSVRWGVRLGVSYRPP